MIKHRVMDFEMYKSFKLYVLYFGISMHLFCLFLVLAKSIL